MATGGIATNDKKVLGEKNLETEHHPTASSSTPSEAYRSKVWEDLRTLLQKDELTDVMLAAEGRSIPCHKVLLAAATKFFRYKFITHPESLEHNILNIEDMDFDTLTSVVSFIYSGDIDLTMEKTEKLIPASGTLMLPHLLEKCKTFLENLTSSNRSACADVYRIASSNSLDDTAQKARQVMSEQLQIVLFKEMSETEEEEPSVHPFRHQEEISRDRALLAVCDDYSHYYYIWKETESNWVRKPLIKFHTVMDSSACLTGDGIVFTGGMINNNNVKQCWKLSLPDMECTVVTDLNVARSDHASVCVGGQVYVLGGYGLAISEKLRSVEYLDKKTESWCVTTDMPSCLSGHTAVNYKYFIYVFGGLNETLSYSMQSFVFDTVSKTWRRIADMGQRCTQGSSTVYRDRIYVLGVDDNCFMSYNPDQDQWTFLSRPRVYPAGRISAVWGDQILLCGGYNTEIEEYNPDIDTWTYWKRSLPRQRCYGVFAVYL